MSTTQSRTVAIAGQSHNNLRLFVTFSAKGRRLVLSEAGRGEAGFLVAYIASEDLEGTLALSQPDVLVIDEREEEDRAVLIQRLRMLRRRHPELKCVLLVDELETEFLVLAFQAGIRGAIAVEDDGGKMLARCLRSVHAGQVWIADAVLNGVLQAFSKQMTPVIRIDRDSMSPREQQVMSLVIEGMSNREIARVLGVTESTVKKYVYEVFNKTGASSRVELILQALHSEWRERGEVTEILNLDSPCCGGTAA